MIGMLINFLKAVEDAIPPPPHGHHAITYARYGSDAAGWEDKLALQIAVPSYIGGNAVFHCWFLDEADLCEPLYSVIVKIVTDLVQQDPTAQISDTALRYFPHE